MDGLGFSCHRLPFSEPGTPDVNNLYARIGDSAPNFCFAGHTDVVPTGELSEWTAEQKLGKPLAEGRNEQAPSLYCAVIVKRVDEQTRAKTSINDLLRE